MSELPDLDALRLLVRVGRTGSLGKAAAEQGVSQPAVTSRIQAVERLVGFPVLARGARGSSLTPEGALLTDWAQRLLAVADDVTAGIAALQDVDGADDADGGPVRVVTTPVVAETLLPGWLGRLATADPEASVRLVAPDAEDVPEAVLDGEAGLGFLDGPLPAGRDLSALASRVVGREALALVAGRPHPWSRRVVPVGPEELAETALLDRTHGGWRAAVTDALVGHEPIAPVADEHATAAGLLDAVRTGAAPAVLSLRVVGDDLASGRLVRVPVEGVDLTRRVRALWRRGARPTGGGAELLRIAALGDVWPGTDAGGADRP